MAVPVGVPLTMIEPVLVVLLCRVILQLELTVRFPFTVKNVSSVSVRDASPIMVRLSNCARFVELSLLSVKSSLSITQ